MSPKRTVKISRSGLLRCPNCNAHIRAAEDVQQTRCVFCAAQVRSAVGQPGALQRMLDRGRGGLIAASLFGVAGIGACPEAPGNNVPDIVAGDIYGVPAIFDGVSDAPMTDTPVADAIQDSVEDIGGPDAADADADADATMVQDNIPVPLYGFPPQLDAGGEDAGADSGDAHADADAASDTPMQGDNIPVPLYGIPPSNDASQ